MAATLFMGVVTCLNSYAANPAAPVAAPATVVVPAKEAAKSQEAKVEMVGKADLVKGEASYGTVCAACHAPDGNSMIPVNPKLAQQHPEYLVKQLQEFKSGKRSNAIMTGMVAALSEQDMKNIAAWLATKANKPGQAKDKELITMGEKIYRGGIADRQVPACAGCHSPNGAGIPSIYPRVSGQHADYTALQLNTFRDGSRKNSVAMTQVAAKMNDREIKAVADYMAGLR
ncbi:MAG TPA: c-type cytochrome [Burkholderiaceae bacterium]|nr:c-type cytochrome [Burkholderiaceae bacterium]